MSPFHLFLLLKYLSQDRSRVFLLLQEKVKVNGAGSLSPRVVTLRRPDRLLLRQQMGGICNSVWRLLHAASFHILSPRLSHSPCKNHISLLSSDLQIICQNYNKVSWRQQIVPKQILGTYFYAGSLGLGYTGRPCDLGGQFKCSLSEMVKVIRY